MTGYGLATADAPESRYSVEIKSLNSKFFELNLKLPKAYSEKELAVRNLCSKEIERGKVSVSISAERNTGEVKGATINTVLVQQYFNQLKALDLELGAGSQDLLSTILTFPEVISYAEETVSEEEWEQVQHTFQEALRNFNSFRQAEGAVLSKDLSMRIGNILSHLRALEDLEPQRITHIRDKFSKFLEDAVGKVNVDQNRFEQELIYYIDKIDITEEKIRLKSHCDYFVQTLGSADANGKKLGFISQEIGREINTMGAKANDAAMQKLVVGMKEELEKIKEQLLNVL
ncbi:YicC family protein [Pedobacter yulinensis]|uniref:YicC family protein n=2 Tax=Pedobacter yulinensis TaxID=2126353 RepID=A0A2T3HSA0_9SPHI|nr:YicC family protein [Pedobacter yulinensis]